VHLDRLWGNIFSYESGKFFFKRPKHLPHPATVTFGEPMRSSETYPNPVSATLVPQVIAEMGSDAARVRKSKGDLLHLRFICSARKNWSAFAMADSSGRELTYGKTLTAAVMVANWVRANCSGEQMVGLLVPSSVSGALANLGVMLAGRAAVNLNFTAGREAMASAKDQCQLRTVITSKTLLAKAKLDALAGAVCIEDILSGVSASGRFRALLAARWMPARARAGRHGATEQTPDSLATVTFSSGSTGLPKGVMLSHYNIIANIEAMEQVFSINKHDRIVGVLPFFHSFGYTVTIWFPMLAGCGALYHPNPTDAKAIGDLVLRHKGTFLLSTPTFCSTYTRKCTKEQFASLRFVLVGAEKLCANVREAFQAAFGLDLMEGYGCTEMAPVVAVNVADWSDGNDVQTDHKPGTVGHPLPGVSVKTVNPSTMEPVAPGDEGLLLVKGANRMLGYLGQAEHTADVLRDGWYVTGDIAIVDEDGFIRIMDRLSRFSKIGGEMVPHLRVEEAMYNALGGHPCAVIAIPDDHKGERLIAFYARPDVTPAALWQQLADTDMPRIWLPKRENIYQLDCLPTLGTGKLDLSGLKQQALDLARPAKADQA